MANSNLSPFDFINAINNKTKKNQHLLEGENGELNEKSYLAFIINRHFSYFEDTLFVANTLNKYPKLPPRMQYDFYCLLIRKRKRFAKWIKPDEDDVVNTIMEYYSMNKKHAKEAAKILSTETINSIKSKLYHGGYKRKLV